jgi:Protein of unknown function (DUF1077)
MLSHASAIMYYQTLVISYAVRLFPATNMRSPPSAVFQRDPELKMNVLVPRLLFCLIHFGGLAFAVHRINTMGLLPVHASDWVSALQVPVIKESFARVSM